jgi:hypothetical protein
MTEILPDTTSLEGRSDERMTFIDTVRHVAATRNEDQFDDDPIDNLARALSELREALIEGKITIEWTDDRYSKGFNLYALYAIDQPPNYMEWAIGYIAEEVAIPDPRPEFLDRSYLTELRRLRKLVLAKTRVFELWPNRSVALSDRSRQIANIQVTKSPLTAEQLEASVREEAKCIYQTSRPNINDAEKLIRDAVTGAKRDLIRSILKEDEFSQKRLPSGNSRARNT